MSSAIISNGKKAKDIKTEALGTRQSGPSPHNEDRKEYKNLEPNARTWIDIAYTIIVTAPAVIAAVSSLRNGKKLRDNLPRRKRKRATGHSTSNRTRKG